MALTDSAVRNASARPKSYRLADSGGLYLEVAPSGGKWWRLKYRIGGKEKRLSLGVYPDVGLKAARADRDEKRKQIAAGIDPSAHRQAEKASAKLSGENGFEVVAREWFGKFSPGWAKTHSTKIIRRLEANVFPWLGSRPVGEIEPMELLAVLRRVESRGKLETAHRVHQNCGQVLRYAVATGRARRDPSGDLRGALAPWKPQHYASLKDPKAIGELLRQIDQYAGGLVTGSALKLAPMLFVRPGELRRAEWSEFNFDAAEWRIPEEKMKAKVQHIVPLSKQALDVLRDLQPLTGSGQFLFPGLRSRSEPISENTLNAALRRMGYSKEQMTSHGWRSIASTTLNEQGWNRDAIERQLAHGERDQVRAAYNFAELLPERRKMMQAWSDYLDKLKAGTAGGSRPEA